MSPGVIVLVTVINQSLGLTRFLILSVVDSRAWFFRQGKGKWFPVLLHWKGLKHRKFLGKRDSRFWGKWTIVEACLLETVLSFLCTPNVLPTYQNITKLYNFMVNSNCAFYLKLNVNPKKEKQVLGKLNFKHSRQGTLENLFYGLWLRQKY